MCFVYRAEKTEVLNDDLQQVGLWNSCYTSKWIGNVYNVIYTLYISSLCTGPNFIELLSTKTCLAWNFFLDRNRITSKIHLRCILPVTGIQLVFAFPENHMEIWLEIRFLWRQKFHAKQICVLSSSMKLGPGLLLLLLSCLQCINNESDCYTSGL